MRERTLRSSRYLLGLSERPSPVGRGEDPLALARPRCAPFAVSPGNHPLALPSPRRPPFAWRLMALVAWTGFAAAGPSDDVPF